MYDSGNVYSGLPLRVVKCVRDLLAAHVFRTKIVFFFLAISCLPVLNFCIYTSYTERKFEEGEYSYTHPVTYVNEGEKKKKKEEDGCGRSRERSARDSKLQDECNR
jgi:hypothetical protein